MRAKHRALAALCVALWAAQGAALDLRQACESALANDPTYRAAVKDYESGIENEAIGRSAVLPRIHASYYAARNEATQRGPQFSGGAPASHTWQYPSDYGGLFLNQPLFNLEAMARWRQGEAQADFSRWKLRSNTQDLLVRVVQAYLEALFAEDQLRYQEAERDAFRERVTVNKRLFEKGEESVTSVLEAQTAYQLAEAKVVEYRDALENARRKLAAMTRAGEQEVRRLVRLSGPFAPLPLTPARLDEWKERALEMNPVIQAMSRQAAIAYQEYKKNDSAHYPAVSLVGGITTQSSNTVTSINQDTDHAYLGLQLNIPLYSGGETAARSRQAIANFERSQAEKDAATDKVLTELQQQYDVVRSAALRIEALGKAADSSSELVKSMRMGVEKGERINLDVLLAEKALLTIRRDLAQAKYNYLIAYLKLHQLGGELETEKISLVVQLF